MKALVTGGGGFLGRYIVSALLARGDRVRIFARGDYPDLREQGAETFRGDLASLPDLLKACDGQDTVFHTAACPGIMVRRRPYYETNVIGTRHVIRACLDCGVEKLIYTSSPSVVDGGDAHEGITEEVGYPKKYLAYYPETKAIAERDVLASNGKSWSESGAKARGYDGALLTCALRPRLIWGPGDRNLVPRLFDRVRRGKMIQVGDGTNMLSFTYVENAAKGHLQACDALTKESPVAGSAYFLAQPEPINCWNWINSLLKSNGLPSIRRKISFRQAWILGGLLEFFYKVTFRRGEPIMTRFLATQFAQSHWFSIEKAKKDFGYDPEVSTEEGMRRLLEYINKEKF